MKEFDNGFKLTKKQKLVIEKFLEEKSLFIHGPAGTGKSYIALKAALIGMVEGKFDSLILIRSIVPTRDIGFLPGSLEEKINPYIAFYEPMIRDILSDIAPKQTDKIMKEIIFESTSFLRGKTYDNSIVIIEEVQNLNLHELNSAMTRIGINTQVLVTGSSSQIDLQTKDSCFDKAISIISKMEEFFHIVKMTKEDIVRSDFVKKWCEVYEEVSQI